MSFTLNKIDRYKYIIPSSSQKGMRVDGMIIASEKLIKHIELEGTYKQIINVAHLPGIQKYSIGMPDIHWGYGFPIGGVAAVAVDENGVVSPGGVGSDINCGVRILILPITYNEIKNNIKELTELFFNEIPAGLGFKGKIKLSKKELANVAKEGAKWAVANGYGFDEDLEAIEDFGVLPQGSLENVSKSAIKRGLEQLGTLGSGNHFLEIQKVVQVYNDKIATKFGIYEKQVTIMIHTGSRGFGYQICEDYLQNMQPVMQKYKIKLPDRQLASAPIKSSEAKAYLSAMSAAANYAWANREVITHFVRSSIKSILKIKPSKIKLLYDVAHNIAKFEKHKVNNRLKNLLVHRKGATRAFPANNPVLAEKFKSTGQPVIIPGDMGSYSYILVGTETAMEETFGTVAHGAGRILSRRKAKKIANKEKIMEEFVKKGIFIKSKSWRTIAEEIPDAYKDIEEVIKVIEGANLAKKIAKLEPIAVIKG